MSNFDKESPIRDRFQTTIPQSVREKAGLQIGDTLLWQYDECRKEIIVIKRPPSFTDELFELNK